MFNSISWQSYWLTLALLTAGYYLTIYLLYYRSDFKIIRPRTSPGNARPSPVPTSKGEEDPTTVVQSSLFDENDASLLPAPALDTEEYLADNCIDELTAFFEQAKRRKWTKAELIPALEGILRKYPMLKTSIYKDPIGSVILSQSEDFCSLRLEREDMVRVWQQA